eukprot:1296527-Pyramimonas_sp.AAC.1
MSRFDSRAFSSKLGSPSAPHPSPPNLLAIRVIVLVLIPPRATPPHHRLRLLHRAYHRFPLPPFRLPQRPHRRHRIPHYRFPHPSILHHPSTPPTSVASKVRRSPHLLNTTLGPPRVGSEAGGGKGDGRAHGA